MAVSYYNYLSSTRKREQSTVIKITNNTIINGHSLVKMTTPHTVDVVIDGNKGINLTGELINAKIYVDQNKLNAFLKEITPLLSDLPAEESAALKDILADLASPELADKTSPLTRLLEFGKEVGTAVVAKVITSFLQE